MSKRTEAISDLTGAAKDAGGSHGTIENKMRGMERFGEFCYEKGFQIRGVDSIGTRHIQAFVAEKMEAINRQQDPDKYNGMVRSLHNQMSNIRTSLKAGGRADFAKNPVIGNKELGIPKADRSGTNKAATPEEFKKLVDTMAKIDKGLAVVLQLERSFGLRGMESIRAADSLKSWLKQAEKGGPIRVIAGTKGGRPRDSAPANRAEGIAAIKAAIEVAKERGGKLLEGTLKEAKDFYRNTMHNHGEITGHALRYAYAQEKLGQYSEDYSRKEAIGLVAADLGHGTDRTEIVNNVYCQESAD